MASQPNIATSSVDVVAILDQNFNQLFRLARPIKAAIKEDSKVMEHPLETGATVVDHTIILPVEIELSLMLTNGEYRDVYQSIRQSFRNRDLLIVQTKTATYENQIIASLPHEEDPEQFDAIAVALKLREVQQVASSVIKLAPRAPKNTSTVDRGQQQPVESTKPSSILFGIFH